MIIYLDPEIFPPSPKALKAASGAAMVISSPWPAPYEGWKPGLHELADPEAPTEPVEDLQSLKQQLQDLQAKVDALSDPDG